MSFLATVVGTMVNAVVNILVNDTIDFIMLKEGRPLNGIVASVKGFAQKCGTTITNSGLLAILAVFGFSTDLGLDQPESAVFACNLARFLIPAMIVITLGLTFYRSRKEGASHA